MEAIKEMNLDKIDLEYKSKGAEKMNNVQFGKNMILYGPPGTGKTYNSVIYSVAICDGRDLKEVEADPYGETLQRYNELKEEGRIAFTTFHQSYGYEEFIEGIKPKLDEDNGTLGYTIENGVFKEFCFRAKTKRVLNTGDLPIKETPRIWSLILNDHKEECFEQNMVSLRLTTLGDEEYVEDENLSWRTKQMLHAFIYEMEEGDIVISQRTARNINGIGIVSGGYQYNDSKTYPRQRPVQWLIKNIDEDMVPYMPEGKKQLPGFAISSCNSIDMDAVNQVLEKYAAGTELSVEQETKPYVFIIDEINRGNISKIFGELITLIEDTKRAGEDEAMEATLPYSGEAFSVPNNVYIIGTMNTADRSIALMDTALRRRFRFVEMMPDSKVLESLGVGEIEIDGIKLNVAKMLDTINARISYLYDREHMIGHAFFTKLAKEDVPSLDTLADIFEKNIIPLLQEYFYEDYEKIQLVLGDNGKPEEYKFILDQPLKEELFNGTLEIDLPEKSYRVQREALRELESYKQIGKDL